jgi:hypothetical protein
MAPERLRITDLSSSEPGEWPTGRVKRVRAESHDVRREIPPIHLDGLYEEDELYRVWLQFFREVIPEEYR